MYIIGHCETTAATGIFADDDVTGPGITALMLPDYARCHDWGYAQCFNPCPEERLAMLVRAHILGDWWVHFGDSSEKVRRGWAYRRMGVFASRYDRFFSEATAAGLRAAGPPNDTVRGFSHTMMEYSIDTWLSEKFDQARFLRIKESVARLTNTNGGLSVEIGHLLTDFGLAIDHEQLIQDANDFVHRVAISESPHDFACWAGAKKFGLRPCLKARDYVRRFLEEANAEIDDGEYSDVVARIVEFMRIHLTAVGGRRAAGWI